MAGDRLSLPFCLSTTQIPSRSSNNGKHDTQFTQKEIRASANYQPNYWTHEFLQSLGNHLPVETLQERAKKLEENVRLMINGMDMDSLNLLELVDNMERLGLGYRFHEDINKALERIVSIDNFQGQTHRDLHETALCFRILRQHGFHVSQDVFTSFKDKEGKFKSEISNDVKGMLSLYEASHLTFEGESLWEANAFSRTHLMNLMKEGMEAKMEKQVRHVLEGLPYHQSFHRPEARWYIESYDKTEPHNLLLLELAKLEFNMVQSSHQKELKEISRWWRDIGLVRKLNFARDRIVETFIWSLGILPEPQFINCHKELTKVGKLLVIVDDVYDIYGTLDELELFTDVVERWNVNTINTLPDYMILCFLAVYNTVNVMAYDIFKERGVNSLPYLTKAWSDLCKSYLQEAKWFHNKVIPPFNDNLRGLDFMTNIMLDEIERGQTSVSIVSYLHETGLSKENAYEYYKTLIEKEWQILNKYLVMDSIFPKSFVKVAINLARISQYIYQYGDGYGRQNNISKSRIKSLLVDPIQLMCHDDVEKVEL
ncbi:Isoprene synthase, chloroplastic, partial [Mucuna pruriens]